MGAYPMNIKNYVPQDVMECLKIEEPFKPVRSEAAIYSTEDPKGSTTMVRLSNETGADWMLEVDGQQVLEYYYVDSGYGLVLPERPYEEQIDDWKHGYMWSRFKLAQNCGSLTKRTASVYDEYGYYFWVKYKARLYEIVQDPDKALIELQLGEWFPGTLDRLKYDSTFMSDTLSQISTRITGYRLTSYSLENNKFSLLVERMGSPAIPLIAYAIIGVLGLLGITVITWKVVDFYDKKLMYEEETNNQEFFNSLYEGFLSEGYSQADATGMALDVTGRLKSQQDEMNIYKYIKYGALAMGSLMTLSILSGFRRSR